MRWEVHSKDSTTGYVGHAETTPLAEAVEELWRKYVAVAASKNAETNWDHLRVEIWLDSGRVILFPATFPFRIRTEKTVVQIICPDLLASYNETAKSSMPDAQFESWAKETEDKVVSLVAGATRQMNLPQCLGRPTVKILYYGTDLEKPVREENLSA